jgi:hypothetical protein
VGSEDWAVFGIPASATLAVCPNAQATSAAALQEGIGGPCPNFTHPEKHLILLTAGAGKWSELL